VHNDSNNKDLYSKNRHADQVGIGTKNVQSDEQHHLGMQPP